MTLRLARCIGCGELVSPGPRCASCRRAWAKAYDRARPEHHAIYRTAAWRRLSLEVRQAESRCRWCLKPLPLSQRVADHIVPIDRVVDPLNRDNLAVACKGCNTKRGRNARTPDPEASMRGEVKRGPARHNVMTVGARMAEILEGGE